MIARCYRRYKFRKCVKNWVFQRTKEKKGGKITWKDLSNSLNESKGHKSVNKFIEYLR